MAAPTESASLFNDDFDIDIDDIAVIEADERRAEILPPPAPNPRPNRDRPVDSPRFEKPQTLQSAQVSRSESDLLFDEIDDVIFDEDASFDFGPIAQKCSDEFAAPSSRSSVEGPAGTNARSRSPVTSREIKPAASSSDPAAFPFQRPFQTKADPCPTKKLSDLKIEAENRPHANRSPEILPTKTIEATATKRSSSAISPPAVNSPASKMHCPQTSNVKKTPANNRKITDWITKSAESSNPSRSSPPTDSISDLLAIKLDGNSVVHKTIKGKVTKFDNLSKNDRQWQLNATITDATGSIDTVFSSEASFPTHFNFPKSIKTIKFTFIINFPFFISPDSRIDVGLQRRRIFGEKKIEKNGSQRGGVFATG